jgi:hypothetical protein
VRSFKAFLLIGALFLVVLVSLLCMLCPMFASSRRRIVVRCFEEKEFQESGFEEKEFQESKC